MEILRDTSLHINYKVLLTVQHVLNRIVLPEASLQAPGAGAAFAPHVAVGTLGAA